MEAIEFWRVKSQCQMIDTANIQLLTSCGKVVNDPIITCE